MPENARLSSNIAQFELDFVKREATPRLLMKPSIQHLLAAVSSSNTFFSNYLVFNAHVRRFIIGFTKLIYSPQLDTI